MSTDYDACQNCNRFGELDFNGYCSDCAIEERESEKAKAEGRDS